VVSGYYNDVGGNLNNVVTGKDTNGYKNRGVRGKPENRNESNDDLSFFKTRTTIVSLQSDGDIDPATVTPMTAFQRYGGLDSRLFERRFGWGAAHANLQASLLASSS
jgi:iron complex outermembrane receptor protein